MVLVATAVRAYRERESHCIMKRWRQMVQLSFGMHRITTHKHTWIDAQEMRRDAWLLIWLLVEKIVSLTTHIHTVLLFFADHCFCLPSRQLWWPVIPELTRIPESLEKMPAAKGHQNVASNALNSRTSIPQQISRWCHLFLMWHSMFSKHMFLSLSSNSRDERKEHLLTLERETVIVSRIFHSFLFALFIFTFRLLFLPFSRVPNANTDVSFWFNGWRTEAVSPESMVDVERSCCSSV